MAFSEVPPLVPQMEHRKQRVLVAIAIGLIPLGLYVVVAVCAVALTLFVARVSVPPDAFLAQRQIDLSGIIAGLVLAFILYAVAALLIVRRTLQPSQAWLRSRTIFWTLGTSALLMLAPIILAVLQPQQPAP